MKCRGGGMADTADLKFAAPKGCEGSSPSSGTNVSILQAYLRELLFCVQVICPCAKIEGGYMTVEMQAVVRTTVQDFSWPDLFLKEIAECDVSKIVKEIRDQIVIDSIGMKSLNRFQGETLGELRIPENSIGPKWIFQVLKTQVKARHKVKHTVRRRGTNV
jgi:hypothetical protein